MSLVSRNAILAVLSKHYAKVGITIVSNLLDLKILVAKNPDLVFLGMKFIPVNSSLGFSDPNKIWIADYLDEHNIAYTGSNQSAHNLELNKPLAKQRVLEAGLNTSAFCVALQNQTQNIADITPNYPVFIKPTNRGGGVGVDANSLAHNFADLQAKVQSITNNLQSDSLIEEYLPGREFSVAILKNEYDAGYCVMPIELSAPVGKDESSMLSVDVKTSNTEVVSGVSDLGLKASLTELALDSFIAIGARDYGRIDLRLDALGVPHFLEANLIPSLISGYGSFPKSCLLNLGLDYEPMILSIVRLGLARTADVDEEVLVPINSAPAFNIA